MTRMQKASATRVMARAPFELRSWAKPLMWSGAAAAALLIGYADLMRGGLTLSALALSVGYVILVPIAIVCVPKAASVT